jgi:hypothetical protein
VSCSSGCHDNLCCLPLPTSPQLLLLLLLLLCPVCLLLHLPLSLQHSRHAAIPLLPSLHSSPLLLWLPTRCLPLLCSFGNRSSSMVCGSGAC